MEALLESEARSINEKYAQMREELAATHEAEKAKIAKTLEDAKKFSLQDDVRLTGGAEGKT